MRLLAGLGFTLLAACATERQHAGPAAAPESETAQIRSTTGYAVVYEWGTCLFGVDADKLDPSFDVPTLVPPGPHSITVGAYRYIPFGLGPCLTGKTKVRARLEFDAAAGRRYFVRTTPGANGVWLEDDAGNVVAGEKH